MNKENLISEIREVEKQYYASCERNYGYEGSTDSFKYHSQLEILIKLLNTYFEQEYFYKRMI